MANQQDDWINYGRDYKASLLQKSDFKAHTILFTCLACCIIIILLCRFTYLDEITRSDLARVVPSGQTKVIQSLEGGIVEKIFVKEGQLVHTGELLAEIDDTQFNNQLSQNKLQIAALKLKSLRLLAEANGTPFQVPPELEDEAQSQFYSELKLYQSRQEELKLKVQQLLSQKSQLNQEYLELQASINETKRTLTLKNQEHQMMKSVQSSGSGAVSAKELLDIQRSVNELEGQIEQKNFRLNKTRDERDNLNDKIEEIKVAFEREAFDEFNKIKIELSKLLKEVVTISDKVDRSLLRSPVNGVIQRIATHTEGSVLRGGDTLFEIVPVDDTLLIEARVNPKDIGFIHKGDRAHVKITAFDSALYGGLEGNVQKISADVISEKDQTYYLVTIKTQKSYLERFDHKYPIIPGMMASVDIITGKKTVLTYIMKPIMKAQQRALTER